VPYTTLFSKSTGKIISSIRGGRSSKRQHSDIHWPIFPPQQVLVEVNRYCYWYQVPGIGNNIHEENIMGDVGGGDSQPLSNKKKRISWADVVSGNR
jgi:hypothetical protein